jgi:hypothetical protein
LNDEILSSFYSLQRRRRLPKVDGTTSAAQQANITYSGLLPTSGTMDGTVPKLNIKVYDPFMRYPFAFSLHRLRLRASNDE